MYWVTALFRQGYDLTDKKTDEMGIIEWLPYLGRVTTNHQLHQDESFNWVTALFRQGYDHLS